MIQKKRQSVTLTTTEPMLFRKPSHRKLHTCTHTHTHTHTAIHKEDRISKDVLLVYYMLTFEMSLSNTWWTVIWAGGLFSPYTFSIAARLAGTLYDGWPVSMGSGSGSCLLFKSHSRAVSSSERRKSAEKQKRKTNFGVSSTHGNSNRGYSQEQQASHSLKQKDTIKWTQL